MLMPNVKVALKLINLILVKDSEIPYSIRK